MSICITDHSKNCEFANELLPLKNTIYTIYKLVPCLVYHFMLLIANLSYYYDMVAASESMEMMTVH